MLDGPKRGRGRPPQFDRTIALAAIQASFCERGFAATSLDVLALATGMNRPSLYAAFGGKRAMFLAAITASQEVWEKALVARLNAPKVFDALASVFANAADSYLAKSPAKDGYMILCTAPAEAEMDAGIRAMLATSIARTDDAFSARLAVAQTRGELRSDLDVPAAAKVLSACLQSLAARARAGASRPELDNLYGGVISLLWTGEPRPTGDHGREGFRVSL